jgi:hypothetical protein
MEHIKLVEIMFVENEDREEIYQHFPLNSTSILLVVTAEYFAVCLYKGHDK